MKLHIMASFRTHFRLRDEEVLASQSDYQHFWRKISEKSTHLGMAFSDILFLHKSNERDEKLSRFRTVDTDSLLRPLHVLEFHVDANCSVMESAWHQAMDNYPQYSKIITNVKLINQSASVRIYNHSVGLLQVDLDISEFIANQLVDNVPDQFDLLQEFGVTFGEIFSQLLYQKHIYEYLHGLTKTFHDAHRFLFVDHFNYNSAIANAVLTQGSTKLEQTVRVNWVTRTLLFEPKDSNNLSAIITHWLKDCGDQKLIDDTVNESSTCAIRWLNYLFREQSYTWKLKDNGEIDYPCPFADEWQAMLNAQYYYAAFEALNDSLTSTLSNSYRNSNGNGNRGSLLRELGRRLEQDIITANLATLEYQNNYAYYKRSVGVTMKQIMKGWDFDEAILKEVTWKRVLCEQRIDELHKKAESRSSFYSDLLLLSIALISVSAFLFQINEYGRTMSHDADLAVYESNSWNLIEYISERPTDFVIWLSLALIVIFGVLYAWFRRMKVMD